MNKMVGFQCLKHTELHNAKSRFKTDYRHFSIVGTSYTFSRTEFKELEGFGEDTDALNFICQKCFVS